MLRILSLSLILIASAVLRGQAADGGGSSAPVDVAPAVVDPVVTAPVTKGVDWNGVVQQSLFFAGVQHAFRYATEPGTRDGMKGKFFPGYAHAVGNLHGWSDGDPFYVNYVGHPMQGAVSGFIYLQNDPEARLLRAGRDRRYWKSRLKAMGYSFAYSTLFEIGPFSEASIGKVQGHRPQQGFVDHVVTPLIGTGWLVAEEFLDERVVLPFERRFQNNWARMMVRSWLNPGRSFTNALRFKSPWYRDNRGGILLHHYRPVAEVPPEAPRDYPLAAKFELTAVPQWTRFGGDQCTGGGGQAAYRLSPSWMIVGQVDGCQLRALPTNTSGDLLTYTIGPRWTPASSRRISPYAQFLIGGQKRTEYTVDPEAKARLVAGALAAGANPPREEAYTTQSIRAGLALRAGTGVDVRIHPALAVRLASVEYGRYWTGAPATGAGARTAPGGLQVSGGLIFRMGTW